MNRLKVSALFLYSFQNTSDGLIPESIGVATVKLIIQHHYHALVIDPANVAL